MCTNATIPIEVFINKSFTYLKKRNPYICMKEKINLLISEATKAKDHKRLDLLRLIKAELLTAEKSGKEYNDVKILLKMVDQRKESIRQYTSAGRFDLVSKEQEEIDLINEYLPKQPSDEEIRAFTNEIIRSRKAAGDILTMKDMKSILSEVQGKYPCVSGKIVSEELKKSI